MMRSVRCSAEVERELDGAPAGVGMDEFDSLGGALVDNTPAGVAIARVAALDFAIGIAIRNPEFEVEHAVDRVVVDPRQRRAVAAGRLHRSSDDNPVVKSSRRRVLDGFLSPTDAERRGDAVGCQRPRIFFSLQIRRVLCFLAAQTARAGQPKTADCNKELTAVHTSLVEDKHEKPTTRSKCHLIGQLDPSGDDVQ